MVIGPDTERVPWAAAMASRLLRRARRPRRAAVLCALVALMAPAAAPAAGFHRLFDVNGSTAQAVAIARPGSTGTGYSALLLVFQTFKGSGFGGLASMVISSFGKPGPVVPVTNWVAGQPGLVGTQVPVAVFGATDPHGATTVWGSAPNANATSWSSPFGVAAGGPLESLAYGSGITAAVSGTTPVLSLPQAGNIVIQRGLGSGSSALQLTNSADGSTTTADLGVDAATGEVVVGWPSIASTLRDYLQGAVPAVGALQGVPGQFRTALIPTGRDKGAGVFAAYTTDNRHVRLLRYGGGSVAVGSAPKVTAKRLSAATGTDGRIWVMWGDDSNGYLGVTRSNRAVTRFEPIQRLKSGAAILYRLQGDGRLGPLDLFFDGVPNAKGQTVPGEYYARVLPVLSATVGVHRVKNKQGKVIGYQLTVKVADAGDPVAGATVSVGTKQASTGKSGTAKLTLGAPQPKHVTLTVSDKGVYQTLKLSVKLS